MSSVVFLLWLLNLFFLSSSETSTSDVLIYESTPAGIISGVAASNNTNLNVILLSTTSHIGGMCTGGLGRTDIGNYSVIGGLANEFFVRNGKYYNKSIEYMLEAHVALEIFLQMLNESNVNIIIDSPIMSCTVDRDNNINNIISITTINNNTYKSKIYMDASYEGDLFAMCGVSYHIGRESNDLYNETIDGRLVPRQSNQFSYYVNPYDDDGNLLPLVTPYDNETPGQSDNRVQSYNYRLCVTKNQNNRIPFTKPDSYDPARWELLRRQYNLKPPSEGAVPSCNTGSIPNGKYDMNNCGSISSDFIGEADSYVNLSYSDRKVVQELTKNYTLELLWFLCSDDSIPSDVQNVMSNEWGFCADEFTETNGFPPQLYVREGRRMINKHFVFTENTMINTASLNFNSLNQSIGMGGYHFDSHNTQRFACMNSSVCLSKPPNNLNDSCPSLKNCPYAWNEGDVQINYGYPFQIPYMVMIPTENQVNNLFVTVGVSSSHIGFSSIRLEPTWMIIGHSAGIAANILIQDANQNGNNINVNNINLGLLKQILLEQNQILTYDGY